MSVFSSDDFVGTAGTELSVYDALWAKVTGLSGNYVLSGNDSARPSNTVNTGYYKDDSPPSADYKTTGQIIARSVAAGFRAGLFARLDGAGNSGYFVRLNGTTGWELYKRTSGSNVQLGSTVSQSVTASDVFDVEIIAETVGSNVDVTVTRNGSVIIGPITDSSSPHLSAGRPGIYALNSASAGNTTGYHIGTFRAETLGGGGGTAVDPLSGVVSLAGQGVSISQPRTLSPVTGAASLSGAAPSVAQPSTISPSAGAVVVAGAAPYISQPRAVTPGVGAVTVTGQQAVVDQSSGAIQPQAGAIVVAGYSPAILQPGSLSPVAGAVGFSGQAPEIDQPTGAVIRPASGQVSIGGYSPVLSQPRVIAPASAAIVVAGYAPTVSQPAAGDVLPPVRCIGSHSLASSVAVALFAPRCAGSHRTAASVTTTVRPIT